LVLGLVLSTFGGLRAVVVATILIAAVLAYDIALKRSVFGPELMGACRGLNVLLGLSGAADFGGPAAWLVAGAIALFVVGLTWMSRSETETGQNEGAIGGLIVQNIGLAVLLAQAIRPASFPPSGQSRHVLPLEGLLVLGLVALVVNIVGGRAVKEPSPATLQKAVKTSVLALVWLNVGIVAAVRTPAQALAVASLWVPAFVLGKWIYST
jgi:4-hydroxybenzoate polyprenyltransferase